ncbi:NAD-dependent protein deacylase sirtuin-5, mitochondrial-like isoform 1-T2 [Synchiropus picturatus]
MLTSQPSTDLSAFRQLLSKSKDIVIITGPGLSSDNETPSFAGFWRKWQAQDLANPHAFAKNPSRIWEFYHHRRQAVLTADPNPCYQAIAQCEEVLSKQERKVTVITENVDELHRRAGSQNLLEMHGSLFRTRCLECYYEEDNYNNPICPALEGKGLPDRNTEDALILEEDLPRCDHLGCNGLLRPAVVWTGEPLDHDLLRCANDVLNNCDLCLVAGISSTMFPVAMFAHQVVDRGIPVAEFNLEPTLVTMSCRFHFQGPCAEILPFALCCHKN